MALNVFTIFSSSLLLAALSAIPFRHDQTMIFTKAGSLFGHGFPFVFYSPSGSDYGAWFSWPPFLATLIAWLVIVLISFWVIQKIRRFFRS